MATLRPTNEEFSDSSYNNDPRLSQPSSGIRQVRSVQTDKGYDPDKRRGGAKERAASTWDANLQASRDKAEKEAKEEKQRIQAEGIRAVVTTEYQNAGQAAPRRSTSSGSVAQKIRGKKRKGVKSVGGTIVGRSVTLSIWSWGFFIWLWFQLPLTILSLIFMALTEVLYKLFVTTRATADEKGLVSMIVDGVTQVANFFAKVINEFTKLFGFDFEFLNPANVFMLTHLLLILVGWGMLLAMSIIYTMSGQKAFSGNGAGGKNALFVLAFVGYTIPILNILPLFFFWTLLVFKNPR